MIRLTAVTLTLAALPQAAFAEEMRNLDAHVHGVSQLGVVIDGADMLIELRAPGADVMGFEHAPSSAEDQAAFDAAVAALENPQALYGVPAGAGCVLDSMVVNYAGEENDHDEHDHEAHEDHDEHDHEAHEDHDEHDHEAHEDHDEHDHEAHEDHDEHDHEAHEDHDEHDHEEAVHGEFYAEYLFACADPTALDSLELAWFDQFANAKEMDVVIIRDGAQFAAEATSDAPSVALTAR